MSDDDAGLVTIAGTGSGKGVSQVIPTLLTYRGSIIVTDPKGELHAVTARRRAQMGQRVVRIDPFGATGTDAINPLEQVSAVSPYAIDDCTRIATQLLPLHAADRDPFWTQGATQMIAGSLLLYWGEVRQGGNVALQSLSAIGAMLLCIIIWRYGHEKTLLKRSLDFHYPY